MTDKQKYLERFKSLYKVKTGKDLSDSDAMNYFEQLVALVTIIHKPIPKYGE